MAKIVDKTVQLDLVGIDGNAFVILGTFQRQARREGWTKEEVDKVIAEATSSDYDHLLCTIIEHCDMGEEEVDTNNASCCNDEGCDEDCDACKMECGVSG